MVTEPIELRLEKGSTRKNDKGVEVKKRREPVCTVLKDHCQGTLSPTPAAAWGPGAGEKVPVGLKSPQEQAFLGGSGLWSRTLAAV